MPPNEGLESTGGESLGPVPCPACPARTLAPSTSSFRPRWAAIGFTRVFDPVLEMFAGEHVHLDLDVTSADDVLFVTAQGMDFIDENWRFHLVAPWIRPS